MWSVARRAAVTQPYHLTINVSTNPEKHGLMGGRAALSHNLPLTTVTPSQQTLTQTREQTPKLAVDDVLEH